MTDHTSQSPDDSIDILLVEDNPGDIRLTQEAIKATGYETALHPVTDGDEAVDLLCEMAADDPDSLPDLALVDLNLPGRDGCDVLNAIRDHSQLKLMPVIMLTSSSAREDIERCYNAGANAYLTKPADPGDFMALVQNVEQFWLEHVSLPPIPVPSPSSNSQLDQR